MTLPFKANIFYENNKYLICNVVNISEFINTVSSWKTNRKIDKKRIPLIVDAYMKDNVPSNPLFISELKDKNGKIKYRICEGQHRYYAIKDIINNPNYSESIKNDIFNNKIICHVYKKMTEDKTKELFYYLNQSVPVPIKDLTQSPKIKEIVYYIIEKLIQTFPHNQSASQNPKKPNYNIDKVQQQLYHYLLENNMENISKYDLWNDILKLNTYLKKYLNVMKQSVKDKATKGDIYLFLTDNFTEHFIELEDLPNKTISV